MSRAQRVYVIQRVSEGLICANLKVPQWVEDAQLADFLNAKRFQGIVRAEWGRDMEDFRLCEVVPALATPVAQREG